MSEDVREHWLPDQTYLEAIARETRRFRECLAGADGDTRVPGCPDWDVNDLLWHLGGEVQHFWAWVIAHRPEVPTDYPEPTRPEGRRALLAFLDRAHGDLMLRLRNAAPDDVAWSWAADSRLHTVDFTLRRQAHEALIHRVDAEQVIGERTPIDPVLAADGVLECLEVMYAGLPPWGSFDPDGRRVDIEITDLGRRVVLGLGRFTGHDPDTGTDVTSDDVQVLERSAGEGGAPDAVISGTAEQLDLWLWHRADDGALEIHGDEVVLERLDRLLGRSID